MVRVAHHSQVREVHAVQGSFTVVPYHTLRGDIIQLLLTGFLQFQEQGPLGGIPGFDLFSDPVVEP